MPVSTDSPDCDGGFRLPSLPVLTQAADWLTGPRLTGCAMVAQSD
jgi:hypothetical protein